MKLHVKVMCIYILAFIMSALFIVSGCNRTTEESSDTDTTDHETVISESSSEKTIENTVYLAKEKKWRDFYSDEVLEEIHKDKIKYTLYIKYNNHYRDLDFYLPVDIKEYVDHDNMTYDMYQVFDDYGWKKEDDYYYYIVDDMMVKLSFWIPESSQIELIRYDFVYKDDPEEYYYAYIGWFPTDNMKLDINFLPGCHCDYLIKGSDGLYVTYEESIVFTYIISWVSVRPYTNPLIFVPHFDNYCDDFNQHDRYYIYFE